MTLIPIIELCHYCPGIVTALGVSTGLAGGTIMKGGTPEQMERWGVDLMTFDKVGAWAITEPDSGSDALGGMQSTAVRDGDEYVLNGNKTFITNGPYADTIVFYAKLDDGSDTPLRQRQMLTFMLDSGHARARAVQALPQDGPALLADRRTVPAGRAGGHGPPARRGGRARRPRARARRAATRVARVPRATSLTERAGVAAMSLGLIEGAWKLSVEYAKDPAVVRSGRSPQFQLIQLKLARMEIARLNVENLVFRHVEMSAAGKSLTLAEASAMKLYSAQAASEVAMEAVQLFGGNGYMSEFRVEQLARDAKVFQIYAGTDEIQVTHIARDLLGR